MNDIYLRVTLQVLDTGPALGKEENIEEVLVAPLDGNTDASEAIQLPDSGRPNGLSKIDLRDVWGGRTPAVSPEPTAGLLMSSRVILNRSNSTFCPVVCRHSPHATISYSFTS